MKKISLIILIAVSANSFAQNNFNSSLKKLDSLNLIMVNSMLKDNCQAPIVWKALSTQVDLSLYKHVLTDVSDTLFYYDGLYATSLQVMDEDMFFKFITKSKKLIFNQFLTEGSYQVTISLSDYNRLKTKFWTDYLTFITNFDNWKNNPELYKTDIENYYSILNSYITDSCFIKNNSFFAPYTILYSIIVHTTKQLLSKDKCNNQIKILAVIFKVNSKSSNPYSINNLLTRMTNKSSYLLNKYPTPWENKEVTVKPRAEVWFNFPNNPSHIIWVFRSYALYSGTISNGFSYDRMHYFCTEFRWLPCVTETTEYKSAGIEWDCRCNQRWEDQVGGLEAKAFNKSLNDEVALFNSTNYCSNLLKLCIDDLMKIYNL